MNETVDWWARVIGGVGLAVACLGLLLQYRRHRLERPRLSLKADPRDPKSMKRPWEVWFTLTNRGGTHVGISRVDMDSKSKVPFVDQPTTPLPQGAGVGAHEHFSWRMEVWAVDDSEQPVELVTEVTPVVGHKAKVKYTIGTRAFNRTAPQWVAETFIARGAKPK